MSSIASSSKYLRLGLLCLPMLAPTAALTDTSRTEQSSVQIVSIASETSQLNLQEPDDVASSHLISTQPDLGYAGADQLVVVRNGLDGGGFQSDVAVSADGNTIFSAADVSGIFKSTDGGIEFASRNQGLESLKVASVTITPDNQNIVYAGTGDKGKSGGLFRSIDGGETWVKSSAGSSAKFAGNHSDRSHPVAPGHPRSNGNLIVVDVGAEKDSYLDDIVLAGTYKSGIHLFTRGGEKLASIVHDKGFVREIAFDPSIPDTAFAAIQFTNTETNGIYRITYENPNAPVSTLEFATPRPEGLTVLGNGHVYAALGDNGLARYDAKQWSLVNRGLSVRNTNRQWTSVAGYVAGQSDVIYAAANNTGGRANRENYSSIWRSTDGGNRWTPLVDAKANVSDEILGKSRDWWFRTEAFRPAGLGRSNSVVSAIAVVAGDSIDSVSDDIVLVAGRGGLWKSSNGGGLWQPAVSNMQATSNNGVVVNPDKAGQVILLNTDYVLLQTNTGFENSDVSRDKPKGAKSKGFDAVFDNKSGELILAVGARDTNKPGGGEVYVKSIANLGKKSGQAWVSTKLKQATLPNNGRVRGIAYGYHDGTGDTSRTILAAVEDDGVYRFSKGKWTKSTGITIGSTRRSNFVWPDNEVSGVVYLLDLSSGLNRSTDGGLTWTNIWPDLQLRNKDFFNTGYIAVDSRDPTTLYISIQAKKGSAPGNKFKVYRLTGADKGVFKSLDDPRITDISVSADKHRIRRPGPLTTDAEGRLWLTQQQDSKNGISAGLFVMDVPLTGTSFKEVTTDEYRKVAVSPSGIDVSKDGHIYVSQTGSGLVKLRRTCYHSDDC